MSGFPPFCYNNQYFNLTNTSSGGNGIGGASSAGNSTSSAGSSAGAVFVPPKIAVLDKCFIPNKTFEITFLIFSILFFFPAIGFYIKYRNHMLIKYRQPKMVIAAALLYSLNCVLVPVSYFIYK